MGVLKGAGGDGVGGGDTDDRGDSVGFYEPWRTTGDF